MWIYTTFCKLVTCFEDFALCYFYTRTIRDKICSLIFKFVICYNNFTLLLCITDRNSTTNLCDNCKSFWLTSLKKLLDTRKTLCNIISGNTTTMECTHSKLCTRLTDRLCCYDTNCFTDLNRLTCCKVGTVTLSTNTDMGFTGKYCTNLNLCFCSVFSNLFTLAYKCGTLWRNHVVCFYDKLSIITVYIFAGKTSCNSLLKFLDYILSVSNR